MLSTVQKIGPALDLFTVQRPEWGVSEVAQALGTPKSSAHALLATMAEIGLLERTPRARYRLGWRLLVLSGTVMLSAGYRRVALSSMRRTVARWGETMHFAVYERGSVVYVEKVAGRHGPRIPTRTGLRLPAHASAVGKALLAFHPDEEHVDAGALARYTPHTIVSPRALARELDEVRETGLALDREEAIRGLCCAAVPVHGADGVMVGAISMSASRERFERHRDAYVGAIREVGTIVSRELGAAGAPAAHGRPAAPAGPASGREAPGSVGRARGRGR